MSHLNSILGCFCLIFSINAYAAERAYPGLNSTQIGVQNIEYQESLSSFADIGDLTTNFSVTNTVLFASSYTHIDGVWGFLLNTKSDISKEYAKDTWSISGYGDVQSNTSKLGLADLVAQGVYHYRDEFYLTSGGQVKTLGVVRSNFKAIGNAPELNRAILDSDKYLTDPRPPQIVDAPLAIEEDITFINAVFGAHYNTAFAKNRKRMTWSIGADVALPLYTTAKNSQVEQTYGLETIDATFNGFEARLNAGLMFELKKGLALTLNADYMVARYGEMNKTFQWQYVDETSGNQFSLERTAAIPDIEMSAAQITLGILWINE